MIQTLRAIIARLFQTPEQTVTNESLRQSIQATNQDYLAEDANTLAQAEAYTNTQISNLPPSLVPDASTTVKGGSKLSVAPVVATNPIAVGDNDTRNSDARTPLAHAATHTNGTDDIQNATAAQKGLLIAADWNTFNSKQASLGFTPENVANKTTDLTSPDNTKYPTSLAVANAIAGATPTPASLTKTNDTNVTATLTGTPSSALLQAVNIALGWTGTLADARIASASIWNAKLTPNGPIVGATKTKITFDANGLVTGGADATTSDIAEGSNLYFTTARAIASALTGYVSGAGVVAATDSVLQAIQKLNGNIAALITGVSSFNGRTGAVVTGSSDYTTAQVAEMTNLYYTNARAIASVLTGYTSGAGAITVADTILQAIQKLNGNDALKLTKANNLSDVASASSSVTNLGLSTAASLNVGNIAFSFDGQGGVISTSAVAYGVATIAGTIIAWYVLGDVSGSCVLDLKKWNGASYISVIGAGNSPTLSSATYASANQNGSWTSLAVAIGDRFQVTVTSLTTLTKLSGSFTFTKT